MIVIGVVAAGIAIASTWDNSQSHNTLWTSVIKGKNVNDILVYDNIKMNAGKAIYTDQLLAATTGGQITVLDNVIISGKNLAVGGIITGTGGVKVNYGTLTRPTCSATYEGMFWYSNAGTLGTLQICMKTIGGTGFAWFNIQASNP